MTWPAVISVIGAFEGLRESPVCRSGVRGYRGCAIARDDPEGERLSHQRAAARDLPLLPPVALRGVPIRAVTLDVELLHVAGARYVRHKN